jgi:hypothetical protein
MRAGRRGNNRSGGRIQQQRGGYQFKKNHFTQANLSNPHTSQQFLLLGSPTSTMSAVSNISGKPSPTKFRRLKG